MKSYLITKSQLWEQVRKLAGDDERVACHFADYQALHHRLGRHTEHNTLLNTNMTTGIVTMFLMLLLLLLLMLLLLLLLLQQTLPPR